MNKIISMCFPIYNRISTFKYTFSKTIEEVCRTNSDEIEIVVSVNPEEGTISETLEFLEEMKKKTELIINVNKKNIGIGRNARKSFELASGKYIWLIGDDDFILPGCLDRVLDIIHNYPDVGWIYMAHGRLDGYPEEDNSKIIGLTNYLFEDRGYIKNGKQGAIKAHDIFGGSMLFSSANIFLKSAWEEVARDKIRDCPQLGATFCAASKGGIYLDDSINIVAGGEVSWSGRADYSQAINYFRDMRFALEHGFNKSEINQMIKYRMRHDALSLWFRIYRMLFQGNKYGRKSLAFFFRTMPFQTIITTLLLPVIACYLPIRHTYRNHLRKKACIEYKSRPDADQYVLSRLRI